MAAKILLKWLDEHDRPISYLARKCEVDTGRLINLLCGDAHADDAELRALSDANGVPTDDLQRAADAVTRSAATHPCQCYSVAEVAKILKVSSDTVRKELKDGTLRHIVIGDRVQRIPLSALEQRVSGNRDALDGGGGVPGPAGDQASRASIGTSDRSRQSPLF